MRVAVNPTRGLAWVVAKAADAATARRAHGLAVRLYSGSDLQSVWRRARFMLRTLWYLDPSRDWFAFLHANDFRRALMRRMPQLAEKLHRPYCRAQLDVRSRLQRLTSHYAVVEQLGWQALLLDAGRDGLPLASFVGKDGVERHLVLAMAGQFAKEGELCLHLIETGRRLYTVAFSFTLTDSGGRDAAGRAIDVACVQGPDTPDAKELVRALTKASHGWRPRDLVLDMLGDLAKAAGVHDLHGVASRRHIYRHWRKRRAIRLDYDAIWRERGGAPRADGDYVLRLGSAECATRSIADVPSNKRAEYRRRQQLADTLREQLHRTIAPSQGGQSEVIRLSHQQRAVFGMDDK